MPDNLYVPNVKVLNLLMLGVFGPNAHEGNKKYGNHLIPVMLVFIR